MAVMDVKRDPKGTQGPVYTAESATGQKRFTVLLDGADNADDAPIIAAKASGVPAIFSAWSASAIRLRCIEKTPEPLDGLKLWAVTCQYATGPKSEDPLNEPPDVSDDSMSIQQLLEYDRDGKLIANTAGDPLELEEEIQLTVVRIGRNVAAHSYLTTALYRNSVNSRAILGAPAETLWMRIFRASKVIQDDREYWREEMEIVHNHLRCPSGETALNAPASGYIGWARRVANLGRRVWKQVGGVWTLQYLKDGAGELLSERVPINTAGTAQLEKGAKAVWLYFNTKAAVDWAPLRLSID